MADQLFMKEITLSAFLKKSTTLLKNTWYSMNQSIKKTHTFL